MLRLNLEYLLVGTTFKKHVVLLIYFEVVARAHGVQHVNTVLIVFKFLAFHAHVQCQDVKSSLRKKDVIVCCRIHKCHDFTLPKAK
jgi:hypothetical protein